MGTTSNYSQSYPSIAGLDNGKYIANWEVWDASRNLKEIYRKTAKPGSSSNSMLVTSSIVNKGKPRVSKLSNGGFVTTWYEFNKKITVIYGRIYNETEGILVNQLIIAPSSTFNQSAPAVAGLAEGRFVIVWQSESQNLDGSGIFAQIFSPTGEATFYGCTNQNDCSSDTPI